VTNPSPATRSFAHADHGTPREENRSMLMAQKTRRWSRADLARMPKDDGNSYEVVRGELFVTPAPRSAHQQVVVVLHRLIAPYVWAQHLGDVHLPRSVMVFDGSEVEPDLMVRPAVPMPPPEWSEAPVPLLVVEVLSAITRRRDLGPKRALYLDAGVAEYWIVDAGRRVVRVVRPGEADAVAAGSLTWHPRGASSPLVVDLGGLFFDALGPA
jgi:Uma2 family endonuclease